jgi:hypothetical protein
MLPFVAAKTVPDNHRVMVELLDIEPGTPITVLVIPVSMTVPTVDASMARRKANGWLADHVGHLVMGKNPRMISDGKRTWWRVEAYVTNVYRKPFGPIGFVDVDATTGEVLSDDTVARELEHYGTHLERHPLFVNLSLTRDMAALWRQPISV